MIFSFQSITFAISIKKIIMSYSFCSIMKKLISATMLLLGVCAVAAAQSREITNFDADWRFKLGDSSNAQTAGFNDKSWPHDWSIELDPVESEPGGGAVGYFPTGIGWYRKHFSVPGFSNDKRYTIEFDGVYMNSTVWINGHELGTWPYGYSSFSYDLTPYLKASGNVIAVRVDNSLQPNSRWYSGSGIYRHVRLGRIQLYAGDSGRQSRHQDPVLHHQ